MPATATAKMAAAPKAKRRSNIAAAVDRLGELQAKMAVLAEEAGDLVSAFKDEGIGTWQGDRFYVQVSSRNIPDKIDRRALFEHFGRDALVGLGIVSDGGTTLACSCRPRPDLQADDAAEAA